MKRGTAALFAIDGAGSAVDQIHALALQAHGRIFETWKLRELSTRRLELARWATRRDALIDALAILTGRTDLEIFEELDAELGREKPR